VEEFIRSLSIKTNDQMLAVYLATVIRSTIALHDLINNKVGAWCVGCLFVFWLVGCCCLFGGWW